MADLLIRFPVCAGPALRLWRLAAALACAVFALTRLALLVQAWSEADRAPQALLLTFLGGFLVDALVSGALAAPFLMLQALMPRRWQTSRPVYGITLGLLALYLFSLLFFAVAEGVFWREFGTRFNFIAVDYLVYTHEVIGNIRESYPLGPLVAAIAAAAAGGAWLLRRRLRAAAAAPACGVRALLPGLAALCLPFAGLALLDPPQPAANAYNRELADNGWRSLASALRQNKLDYQRFYATLPVAEVEALLQRLTHHGTPLAAPPAPLQRVIAAAPGARRPNVVLITVESLSAEFLGAFGDRRGLTPNLDQLAAQGLLFTRLYAIGTRTVRGLEALSAALPPTPGQSLVKRPDNGNLNTLGSVLAQQGYRPYFIYGGYGYFDNMNAYFGANGYHVVDRTDFPKESVQFENIWGVADEHLFDQVLATLDRETAAGAPVFAHVMTTSNHRPFTYPDGRIDIPSPGGREGGVKYTDYAIGRFMEAARRRPWFPDTLFVVVADHCASSAGKTRLPVPRYHIPAIVYAPHMISPRRVDRLASQIDLAPTLLALLGIDDGGRFLGRDILTTPAAEERAFLSNYQELGYLKDGVLTVLSPRRQVSAYRVREDREEATPIALVEQLRREAIAYFQGAALLLERHAYRAD
ncbi:MAG: LTA synthase family protein [Pseudomonadota bacterium]